MAGTPYSSGLRRLFVSGTEVEVDQTPYATEAINVIAAILRDERSGSFQKLLADGLGFARSLHGADLQKTNLQNAYLGARSDRAIDLSGADFFRADLSDASLKGAMARGAIFYQARLAHTVLARADLRDANFFEADLQGARFKDAKLEGASFLGARNIPKDIAARLDDRRVWVADAAASSAEARPPSEAPVRVFISRPAVMRAQALGTVDVLRQHVGKMGNVEFVEMPRNAYPSFGALAEARRLVGGCTGVVVVGLGELEIAQGTWRGGTSDERAIQGEAWSSPWPQIEAGIAIGLDLPVLILAPPELATGVFAKDAEGHFIFRLNNIADVPLVSGQRVFADWYAAVRERAAQ